MTKIRIYQGVEKATGKPVTVKLWRNPNSGWHELAVYYGGPKSREENKEYRLTYESIRWLQQLLSSDFDFD